MRVEKGGRGGGLVSYKSNQSCEAVVSVPLTVDLRAAQHKLHCEVRNVIRVGRKVDVLLRL